MILYPHHWKGNCFYQGDTILGLKEENSGNIFCSIYINPAAKVNEVSSDLDDLAEELARHSDENLIMIGGDFNSRASDEITNLDLRRSDARIKRYRLICNVFETFGCFDVFKCRKKLESTHFDKRTKSQSRLDYFFCNQIDQIVNLTTLYSSYSDHRILKACFKKDCEHSNLNGQSYWKLHYNVVKANNEHQNLEKALKGMSEMSLNLPNLNTYDIFKARLRDWLRFLCIEGNKQMKKIENSHIECQAIAYDNPRY